MTTTARATGKLGKLPVRTDVRTLRLRRYVDPSKLPPPPDELDLTEHVNEWPMYANDRIGDCTTAAAGHMIEAWTAAAVGQAIEISESSVLTAFDAVKIVDPRSGEEGAIELDVLRYWRKHGIGRHRMVRSPQSPCMTRPSSGPAPGCSAVSTSACRCLSQHGRRTSGTGRAS